MLFLVEDYITSLENSGFLLDKLCKKSYGSETDGQQFFPCHFTPVQLHEGIKSGKLVQGKFAPSRENFLEGYVNVEGMEKSVNVYLLYFLLARYVSNYYIYLDADFYPRS